mgnify:CR=1 FL=1
MKPARSAEKADGMRVLQLPHYIIKIQQNERTGMTAQLEMENISAAERNELREIVGILELEA